MKNLEIIKGIGFILVTGIGLYFLAFVLMRRIHEDEQRRWVQQMAFLESEQRAMAGIFASSYAHDINNYLLVLNMELEELSESIDRISASQRDRLDRVRAAVGELERLARSLQGIGKKGIPGEVAELALADLVHEVIRFVSKHPRVRNCHISEKLEDVGHFVANATLMQQMLVNLVVNAAEAAGAGGKIEVVLKQKNQDVVLEVHDNGDGVPPMQRDAIFAPFHTTKNAGTGLGLMSVKACAEIHGGDIEVDDSPLGGALFRVIFPVHKAENQSQVPRTQR